MVSLLEKLLFSVYITLSSYEINFGGVKTHNNDFFDNDIVA